MESEDRISALMLEPAMQQLTEVINRTHKLHKEQHQLTRMYRSVCSCGWKSREYGNGDQFNASRTGHLERTIQKAWDMAKAQ